MDSNQQKILAAILVLFGSTLRIPISHFSNNMDEKGYILLYL